MVLRCLRLKLNSYFVLSHHMKLIVPMMRVSMQVMRVMSMTEFTPCRYSIKADVVGRRGQLRPSGKGANLVALDGIQLRELLSFSGWLALAAWYVLSARMRTRCVLIRSTSSCAACGLVRASAYCLSLETHLVVAFELVLDHQGLDGGPQTHLHIVAGEQVVHGLRVNDQGLQNVQT